MQTRFHIRAFPHEAMAHGIPPRIPFLPDNVVQWPTTTLVTGMEGEFLWLDEDLEPTSSVATPFPMRTVLAVAGEEHLIACWLDRELLLANMGTIPLGFTEQGISRAELRRGGTSGQARHPKGHTWSHSLDAEPIAMVCHDGSVLFSLYNRGLYCIDEDATERWRVAPPSWRYTKRRPRSTEIVALHVQGDEFTITSRGGRIQRRSMRNGALLEEFILPAIEGPLEHHFQAGEEHLVCSSDGTVWWLQNLEHRMHIKLSGPVQDAKWDPTINGWRIAGWREEIVLTSHAIHRNETDEIPHRVVFAQGQTFILFNDGSWENAHQAPLVSEEE